jgi:hypothetical protein
MPTASSVLAAPEAATEPRLDACPGCGGHDVRVFYEVPRVPVHSVLLVRSRADALSFPTGRIELCACATCGFIFNRAFDGSRLNYSAEYEETQGFSPTFSAFHRRLAQDLIARYDLHAKELIEIGCGKGEFLTLLCELGGNTGVGFDPAYVHARNTSALRDRLTFIQDFYGEKYGDYRGDFVCCKMTLEHIPQTAGFIGTVRRSIGDRAGTVVFFQIPEMRRVLTDLAFWDVYYEHCSYFTKGSLARLFRSQGFNVAGLWTDYDDQYLMIDARPRLGHPAPSLPEEDDLAAVRAEVAAFEAAIPHRLDRWRRTLRQYREEGRTVVLWGGGSKAVAFLTTLGVQDEVACAVDINPFKHGTFLAGTGHEIVGPAALPEIRPDVVIVMNPIYRDEIGRDLAGLGLAPELLDIDTF